MYIHTWLSFPLPPAPHLINLEWDLTWSRRCPWELVSTTPWLRRVAAAGETEHKQHTAYVTSSDNTTIPNQAAKLKWERSSPLVLAWFLVQETETRPSVSLHCGRIVSLWLMHIVVLYVIMSHHMIETNHASVQWLINCVDRSEGGALNYF